jgi:outer membrane protein TolC
MQRSLSALRLNLDRHSYRVAREDLLNSVYNAFYRVLVLQAQREVKRRTLDDARQRLAIAQTKLGIGMIREIDMLDAELSVDSREIDLQSTESDLEEAMYSLKKAVGLSPEREITPEGEIDTEYRGIEIRWSAAQFLVLAEKRNLDLQNARFNVRRQEVQARLVRNRYLPHVTANVTFSVSGRNFPLQTAGATVGLDISFPEAETPVQASLSGGTSGAASGSRNGSLTVNPVQSITARIDRADAQTALERARSDERSLRRDLSFRIVKQISGYRRRQQTIALERRSLSLENKKLFILEQQVANGTATQVDYLKEQIAVENVEVRLLGDILVLIKQERSLERLAGLDPGELAGAQGGGHGRN